MANTTLKFGNGEWYGKEDTILAYNDENKNFKPLPFDFERGTVATRINKEGLIETVGANEPRVDYKDDSKGALLLEPTKTNLITQSELFSDSYWTKSGASVTSGFISPDGNTNAFKLIEGTSSNQFIRVSLTVSSGNNTISIFAKAGERNWILLWDGHTSKGRYFDVKNGNIGSFRSSAPESSSIENIGNGWYRCSMTVNSGSTNLQNQIYLAKGDGLFDYNGNGSSGVYIYGSQAEVGNLSSYIPTQGTVQTRLNENTSAQIIGYDTSSSFSVFFSFGNSKKTSQSSTNIFSLNTTSGKDIYLYTNSSGTDGLNVYISNGGGYIFGAFNNDAWNVEQSKICITYDISTSRFTYFINGSIYGEQTNVLNLGQTDYVNLISNNNIYEVRDHRFYNNALTDQEAIALTQV